MRKQKKNLLSDPSPFSLDFILHPPTCAKRDKAGVSLFSIPLIVTTSSWSLLLKAGEVLKKKKHKSCDRLPLPHMQLWYLGYSVVSGTYLCYYLYPALFPVRTHQHRGISCSVQWSWKHTCIRRPEVVNIACFFSWDRWDKGLGWMSFLDQRELEMGRSALPRAAAWIQGAAGLSLGLFQLQHRGVESPPHLQPIERGLSRPKRRVSERAGGPRRAALHQAGSLPSTKPSAPRSSGTSWLQWGLHVVDCVHSWTWCFTPCPSWRRPHHKSASLGKPLRCSNGALSPASYSF